MSTLPRVTDLTRERVAREFDDLGPEACVAEIIEDMKASNPELLDMAWRCADDVGEPHRVMAGFCMFYRLLVAQSLTDMPEAKTGPSLSPLPHVTHTTRDRVVQEIDARGAEQFTMDHIDELERHNPGLLQMAHNFATHQPNYLGIMQGVALLWSALLAQVAADRARPQ